MHLQSVLPLCVFTSVGQLCPFDIPCAESLRQMEKNGVEHFHPPGGEVLTPALRLRLN